MLCGLGNLRGSEIVYFKTIGEWSELRFNITDTLSRICRRLEPMLGQDSHRVHE